MFQFQTRVMINIKGWEFLILNKDFQSKQSTFIFLKKKGEGSFNSSTCLIPITRPHFLLEKESQNQIYFLKWFLRWSRSFSDVVGFSEEDEQESGVGACSLVVNSTISNPGGVSSNPSFSILWKIFLCCRVIWLEWGALEEVWKSEQVTSQPVC